MMWIKIQEIPLKEDILFVPQSIVSELVPVVPICYGQKRIRVQIRELPYFMEGEGETFENPQMIKMTASLRQKLLMIECIHYQMNIKDGKIQFGPVVGLLLGNEPYRYNSKYMQRYSDIFGIYEEIGGVICAFSPETIDWKEKSVYGIYHNYFKGKWEYGKFPLPNVVYRRNSATKPMMLQQLKEATGGKLFNSQRLTKWQLYERLKDSKEISTYIPETKIIKNFSDIDEFLNKYKKVILKPTYLSRGRGICVIESLKYEDKTFFVNNYYDNVNSKMFTMQGARKKVRLYDYRYFGKGEIYNFSLWALESFLKKEDFFIRPYLVQPLIPLAKINGNPFDVRVVMQKDESGEWVHSGTECRIADHETFITNISRGGYALFLKETLQKAFGLNVDDELIQKEILDLCYQFCRVMDETGELYAEFGIDVAIDINKKVWFIEANVFPCFNGFKHIDYDTYLLIRYQPLLYATKLDGFGRREQEI